MTQGTQKESVVAKRKLAEIHGDLDALAIVQSRLMAPLQTPAGASMNWYYKAFHEHGVSFEGKKHLWNINSRLTSRVESVIISDRGLFREVIHLAAKGRKESK